MKEKYVYGWYCYRDGSRVEFRYPAMKKSNLHSGGKKITVEVYLGGKWLKRRGVVIDSNGNYMVSPA
jgi:hypothetical protein